MRRPFNLKPTAPQAKQQGYALFIVLMIMIVIALLVVTAVQSYNTEQRISTNDADRKLATSLAEIALREGENKILDFENQTVTFNADCIGTIGSTETKGLCSTANVSIPTSVSNIIVKGSPSENAWSRKSGDKKLYIDQNGASVSLKTDGVNKTPVYIIEYISTDTTQGSTIYRVTAKAWGKNVNTVVMLQSYVANE